MKKQNTKAERISWMTRTSDVVGSFHSTSPEACTTLIRRKIQERCGNTQELMSAIRRMKTGDSGYVTPNEFRLTLLKFGIIVPPHQLEQIFNIFDSDRSGTIDFDEFAMWIMNSEFRPVSITQQNIPKVDKDEILRSRLKICYQTYPTEFASLKKSIDFLYLLSFCHKKNIPLTDAEIRQVFTVLDPSNTGLVDSDKLRLFALQENHSNRPLPALNVEISKPNLHQSIQKVCGKASSQILLNCFSSYKADSRLDFNDFWRCIKAGKLGESQQDSYDLFRALDGHENTPCSLRALYNAIPSSLASTHPSSAPSSSHNQLKPLNTQKTIHQHSFMDYSKASRAIRDVMRENYEKIATLCKSADSLGTGYLSPQTLWKVINDHIMPLKFEDLKLMLRQVPCNNSGDYNYLQFLAPFNLSNLNRSNSTTSDLMSPINKFKKTRSLNSLQTTDHNSQESINPTKDWQNALRACKAQDPEECGFLSQKKFLTILSQNIREKIPKEEIQNIIRTYRIGRNDFDYRSFFRTKLNQLMNENTVFVTSDSMFRIDPGTQSRQLGPAHPWDFNYVNPSSHTLPPTCPPSTSTLESDSQLRNPYWKRACVEPKALSIPSGPFLTSTQIKFQSPSSTNQFSSDPNLIPLLQRLGSHPQYHQLIVDYKRHSLPSHVGLISNKYFLTSLQSIKFPLKKSEFNLLLKEFRAIGFPDTFNYQRMIDMINQL